MKRSLWLLMLFLLAGHVPAASADSACEGRFVNPITDICWSCIFPLSLGSIKVSQGKVPDTANPSMPIQICPAPPPLFRRIGLAIGYWEPMALTDVTRSPGCMVNLGFSLPAFGKTAQGTAKKDEKQVNGAFYHVHWYKYPLTYWLNIITSLGCLEGGDLDIAYLSEIDPTWTDSSLTTILNPEAVIFANPIAQGACAADAIASAFNMPLDVLFCNDRRLMISIFMSLWNVHANWFPVDGKVKFVKHENGKYMKAWLPKASEENEHADIMITTPEGVDVLCRQIAGAVARRIVTYAKEGEECYIDEHLGFIKLGSRVDVYLPIGTEVCVKMGQATTGDQTIIAKLK